MTAHASESPSIVGAPVVPLAEAQEGLWYAQRLDPANPIFNTAQYVDLQGPLDLEAFCAAIADAMTEAEALAVRVVEGDAGPGLVRDAAAPSAVSVIDCRDHADPAAAAVAAMRRDMATPLDLAVDPPAAQMMFVVGANRHFWYQRVHHVVIDGYGTGLLARRVFDLYRAAATGAPPSSRPFAGFGPVLDEDRAYRGSEQREADRAFWMAAFADRPAVVGLADGRPVTAHRYHSCEIALPHDAGDALRALAAASGVSWPDIVTALIGAYIQRHIGGAEAIVGVPAMLRVGSASARVPAMVMNVLPVRIRADESQPIARWLQDTAAQLRQARSHGRYRSEQLRRDLGLLSDQRRLYGVLINVLPFDAAPRLPNLDASVHVLGTGPVDDLTVTIRADAEGQGLRLELDANPTLYSPQALSAHAARLSRFLDRALRAATLAAVPTVTEAEHQRVISGVNATGHPVPDGTLATLIESRLRERPSVAALTFESRTLTRGELDEVTQMWARRLADAGVRRGDFVAVALPRSLELEVALVAVLRAGAAYMPIDLEYPAERVGAMFALAQPKAVLTFASVAQTWPAGVVELLIDAAQPAPATAAEIEPPRPEDPAYVIFTSGSTGTPKGVVIQHRAIVNRLEWMRQHYAIGEGDRILQKTPSTFDVSVWEFFLPLISGATLVMAPPDAHRDPAAIARLLREQHITTVHFVPSMLAQLVAEPSARGLAIARVFCSGEALPASLRDRFHSVISAELHNLYGPTEAAVDVTYWDASRHDRAAIVPIGFPVWNTRMYVLDSCLRPLPPGAPGDLYIAGVQLAREYLGRADLTGERFIADPFAAPGERMYFTGDVARWRDDGAIEYLGRSDFQVKLRGLRIELGEIESALLSDPAVADVAVVVREDRPGDQRLVAYVVARDVDAPLDAAAATALLQRRLPPFMVPSTFVSLDRMPLNASGKLDRRELPIPATGGASVDGAGPASAIGHRVAEHVAEVLGLDAPLSGASDFFALGGHSLLAVQLMRRIRDEWQRDLPLGVLFAHPTIDGLASQIERASESSAARTLAEDGLGVLLPLANRDATRQLFCIHPAGGMAWCYSGLAHALPAGLGACGVQARALDMSQPLPASLIEIAGDYVGEIRRVQPEGPYHLAGWSVGGILAHAMTEVFEAQGQRVATLALLDAYPCDRWRDAAPPNESVALRALLLMAGLDPDRDVAPPLTRERVTATLRASGHALGTLSDTALAGVIRVVEHNSALVRGHRHGRVNADMLYFRAALDHQGGDYSPQEWHPYVNGNLRVQDVPSLHAHMTGRDAIRMIAPLVAERMRA